MAIKDTCVCLYYRNVKASVLVRSVTYCHVHVLFKIFKFPVRYIFFSKNQWRCIENENWCQKTVLNHFQSKLSSKMWLLILFAYTDRLCSFRVKRAGISHVPRVEIKRTARYTLTKKIGRKKMSGNATKNTTTWYQSWIKLKHGTTLLRLVFNRILIKFIYLSLRPLIFVSSFP